MRSVSYVICYLLGIASFIGGVISLVDRRWGDGIAGIGLGAVLFLLAGIYDQAARANDKLGRLLKSDE